MTTFKINDDIPLPSADDVQVQLEQALGMRKRRDEWPFKRMRPGQSVDIPLDMWQRAQNVLNSRKYTLRETYHWEKYPAMRIVRVWKLEGLADVPAPQVRAERAVWGFAEFKVGDHRVWPIELFRQARAAMYACTKYHGFKFEYALDDKRCVFRRVA